MGKLVGRVTDAVGLTNNSGKEALRAQTNATNQANDMQWRMFNQNRDDMKPWTEAGKIALGQLQSGLPEMTRNFGAADFQQDPGYQFRMDQGQQALERGAAARGGLMNGGTLKALARYGQDFASNEYTNAYNRFNNDRDQRFNKLSSLAGVGQSSAAQIGQAGMQTGQSVGSNLMNLGNAQAANSMAATNRLGNMIGQGAQMYMMCDERLKADIEPVSAADLNEVREKVRAYKFKYKDQSHGAGEFIGVMAQELEQTKLGKDLVELDESGHRMINTQKLMSLMLATLAGA